MGPGKIFPGQAAAVKLIFATPAARDTEFFLFFPLASLKNMIKSIRITLRQQIRIVMFFGNKDARRKENIGNRRR
jgi:hypothetical protein